MDRRLAFPSDIFHCLYVVGKIIGPAAAGFAEPVPPALFQLKAKWFNAFPAKSIKGFSSRTRRPVNSRNSWRNSPREAVHDGERSVALRRPFPRSRMLRKGRQTYTDTQTHTLSHTHTHTHTHTHKIRLLILRKKVSEKPSNWGWTYKKRRNKAGMRKLNIALEAIEEAAIIT